MLKLSALSKGHFVYFFGEIFSKLMFFILLPFLGRTITVTEFGVFSLLFPLIQNLLPTASFGLPTSLFRYYFEKNISKKILFSSVFWTWIFSALFWCPIFFLLLRFTTISHYKLYKYHLDDFVVPILISLLSLGFGQIVTELFRAQQKASIFVTLNFLSRFFIVIALIITVSLGFRSSIQLLWSVAFGSIFVFIYSFIIYFNKIQTSLNWIILKKLIYFGYPVMLTPVSALLLYLGNRYVLNYMVSSDEVGIYTMAVSLVQVLALIPATFSRAWVPELFSRLSEGNANRVFFRKIVCYYLVIFIFSCLSFELFSGWLLVIVGGNKYLSALPLFPILISGFIFEVYYTFSVDRLYYAQKVVVVVLLTGLSGMFNIIITFFLVSRFGMAGAAVAFAASMLLQGGVFTFIAQKVDGIKLPHKQLIRYILLGIVGIFLIFYSLSSGREIVIYVFLAIMLALLFRRDYRIIQNNKGNNRG